MTPIDSALLGYLQMIYDMDLFPIRRQVGLQCFPLTLPPLEVFIPCYVALPALISLQFYASPEVVRYLTPPSGFVNGTVYGLNLIPALLWNDVG